MVDRSRMIKVTKRDGSIEDFDVAKLGGMLGRGFRKVGGDISNACELARAIEIFLVRSKRYEISSSALFEMGLKALRHVKMNDAAEILELHRTLRTIRRRFVRIRHENEKLTRWEKSWLVELAIRMWHVSRNTARILAGEVENEIISKNQPEMPREEILDLLNKRMAELGLADAVPVDYEVLGIRE